MLNGISFWTDDIIWRHILTDLGAEFVDRQFADVVFSSGKKLSPIELKAEILRQIDAREDEIIKKLCGAEALTGSQKKIIIALYRGGKLGVSADELQQWLGYSIGATTNTANTAIYQLRKIFGKDFITNKNGRYQLGKL